MADKCNIVAVEIVDQLSEYCSCVGDVGENNIHLTGQRHQPCYLLDAESL